MSTILFPVVVPAELVGETFVVMENMEVRAVPIGNEYEDGLVIAKLGDDMQLRPNTKVKFAQNIWKRAAKMFHTAYAQLSLEQLQALGLTPENVPSVEEILEKFKAVAAKEQAVRAEASAMRRAKAPVLSEAQLQELDQKREIAAQRRAAQAKADAEEMRQLIAASKRVETANLTTDASNPSVSIEPLRQDNVVELLKSIAAISSSKTLTKRLNIEQLVMICEAKQIPADGTKDELAARILSLKSQQNGTFATV